MEIPNQILLSPTSVHLPSYAPTIIFAHLLTSGKSDARTSGKSEYSLCTSILPCSAYVPGCGTSLYGATWTGAGELNCRSSCLSTGFPSISDPPYAGALYLYCSRGSTADSGNSVEL
jgi:hypothetical protein